ncbi:hypothetical protein ABFX02_14G172700 [Erythranthe guttata]
MDAYEATKIVYQRIQTLDPQSASKIMGVLLIQDHGEKEMIRLAFGPESLVHAVILKAKKELGLASPNMPLTPSSTPPSPSPLFCNNNSSRLFGGGGGGVNLPSPLSVNQSSSSSWTNSSSFSDFPNSDELISPGGYNNHNGGGSPSTMNSAAAPFYGNGEVDLIDELHLQDQLSFLNDGPQKSSDFFYPAAAADGGGGLHHHRRSCSVSDVCMGSDDLLNGGFGWKPCLFYARGYCKNGSGCRFVHGDGGAASPDGGAAAVGSPSKFDMMGSTTNFPYSNKCMNFLLQQQQQLSPDSPRALMMSDAMHKFSRIGLNGVNPGSRQIYLTFPADSTFKEEDVSNYFSNYGPVQDVRIPYQQKRMFGFVTFDYPDTVKLILAKGNPHFVCDARVLVKPYKEKGKIPEKHRRQQMERGEFNGCGSPTGLESRDPFDLPLGARMFYNTQDILWRRKLEEQADLQQAIEIQNRRLIGLQLLDVKRNNHHRALSTDAIVSSPIYSPTFYNQNVAISSNLSSLETKENGVVGNSLEKDEDFFVKDESNNNGKDSPKKEDDLHESLEHNLPDSPFASPKAAFSNDTFGAEKGNSVISSQSANNNNLITGLDNIAPFKSCYFQVPRFASGHETIGI